MRERRETACTLAAAQSGFTILEAMVALAVTAVGVLGLGSLQLAALNGAQSSHQRTEAAFLAYDLADRMLHNIDLARDGAYDLAAAETPDAASCRGTGTCTPAELAAADLSEWHALVTAMLVDGDASIETDTPVGSTTTDVTITITWADSRTLPGNGGGDQLVYVIAM